MINPLKGTLRGNRDNPNLLKSYFKIDERSFSDVLGYITSFLDSINYYNLDNEIDGSWKKIIEGDRIIFMCLIINEPTQKLENALQEHAVSGEVSEERRTALLSDLFERHRKITRWKEHLAYLGQTRLSEKISSILHDVLDKKNNDLVEIINASTSKSSQKISLLKREQSSLKSDITAELNDVAYSYLKAIINIKEITLKHLESHVLDYENHSPISAFYIVFAFMYKSVQDSANALSKKHLDFYYKDILDEKKGLGEPTRTVLFFELQPAITSALIEKGTLLSAGKIFESKTDILFETIKPLVVQKVELTEINTLLLEANPYLDSGTKVPLISSVKKRCLMANGKVVSPKNDWYSFGYDKRAVQNIEILDETIGKMGFILASPVLSLSEGKRSIKICVNFNEATTGDTIWKLVSEISQSQSISNESVIHEIFGKGFQVSYTQKMGWALTSNFTVSHDIKKNSIVFEIRLKSSDPAVELGKSLSETLAWPAIKIELNPYAPIYLYSFFQGVSVNTIDLSVDVKNQRELSIYNSLGLVPTATPFEPFGPTPDKGSYLVIGKDELFQKKINSLKVHINWDNLPEAYGGFKTYYNEYSDSIDNDSFLINKQVLVNGNWLQMDSEKLASSVLFKTTPSKTPEGYQSLLLVDSSEICFNKFSDFGLVPNPYFRAEGTFNSASQSGYIRLQLTAPKQGFGRSSYLKDYVDIATFNAKNKAQISLPNQPFSPRASSISVDYTASDQIIFNPKFKKLEAATVGESQFFQISPFLTQNIIKNGIASGNTLFYDYTQEAYLILGFKGINESKTVSLYFHFQRSSTATKMSDTKLSLEYFSGEEWILFGSRSIIRDDTSGFTKSGIVEIIFPQLDLSAAGFNSILWTRVSTPNGAENYPLIKGIYLNAVEVVCTSSDPEITGREIPAGTILKFAGKMPKIKSVSQPVQSGGGVRAETEDRFYTRVSERLRHKNRAVSAWDYERLVLQYFDEVRLVKCTNLNDDFQQMPGSVRVVVMSDRWNVRERHYFSAVALDSMKKFLLSKSSTLINVSVINPKVEHLLVNCSVEFLAEANGGYYLNKLNSEISEFLSPANKTENDLGGIGGKMMPIMLTGHLENLQFIHKVRELSIEHIVRKDGNNFTIGIYHGSEEIKTTTPCSVFSPVARHNINTFDFSEFEDHPGIGSMRIGLDFVIDAIPKAQTKPNSRVDKLERPTSKSILVVKNK